MHRATGQRRARTLQARQESARGTKHVQGMALSRSEWRKRGNRSKEALLEVELTVGGESKRNSRAKLGDPRTQVGSDGSSKCRSVSADPFRRRG